MKLITAPIKKLLEATPIYTHDEHKPSEIPVIAKFFAPSGRFTFYVTESERYDEGNREDYRFYGFMVSPLGQQYDELGYITLGEMEAIRLPFGLRIERDRNYEGQLLDAMKTHNFDYSIYETE